MEYLLLFCIGVCATAIGTLAGGGGLINLPAMLLIGIPIHSAIGANKVSNTVSSLSSFLHLYKKKELTLKESVWIIPISTIGGVSGGLLAWFMTDSKMHILAIILLFIVFITSLMGKGNFDGDESLKMNPISIPGIYSIGLYDGLFGPGQGTLMFYLLSYLKVSYIKAVGLVRLATFSSCFGAAITYISTGKIIWPLTIALLLGSVIGAQIGVHIAEKLNPNYIKPLLRVVTLGLIIQITFNQF